MHGQQSECSFPCLLELVGDGFQLRHQRGVESFFIVDFPEQFSSPRGQVVSQLILEFLDPICRNIIHIAVLSRPNHSYLNLDRNRAVLRLLEDLDNALAAVDLRLRLGIQFRAELSEGCQFAKLSEVTLELSSNLFHGLELRLRTNSRNRQAYGDRRPDALIEQVRLQVDLAVRN